MLSFFSSPFIVTLKLSLNISLWKVKIQTPNPDSRIRNTTIPGMEKRHCINKRRFAVPDYRFWCKLTFLRKLSCAASHTRNSLNSNNEHLQLSVSWTISGIFSWICFSVVELLNIHTFVLRRLNYWYILPNTLELKYTWDLLSFKTFVWMLMRIYQISNGLLWELFSPIFLSDPSGRCWLQKEQDQRSSN